LPYDPASARSDFLKAPNAPGTIVIEPNTSKARLTI